MVSSFVKYIRYEKEIDMLTSIMTVRYTAVSTNIPTPHH